MKPIYRFTNHEWKLVGKYIPRMWMMPGLDAVKLYFDEVL